MSRNGYKLSGWEGWIFGVATGFVIGFGICAWFAGWHV